MSWAYRRSYSNMVPIFVVIVMFGAVIHSVSSIEAVSDIPDCHKSERQALLSFKHHLTDPSDRLSSWVAAGTSCCGWHGVVCDNFTGHVLELHLRGPFSIDDYDPDDQIYGSGQISKLPWLRAGFGGEIPSHLGNISNLLSLGITGLNDYGIHTKNLGWLSGLSMLRYLDLSQVMLPKTSYALQHISALPLLEELHFQGCGIEDISHFSNLVNVNFSNLVTLDLSLNSIRSFRGGLENITYLKYLDLSYCSINSSFPNWLYKFGQLEKLMLPWNDLQGTIADDIANLTLLNHLDLSGNNLEGEIPRTVNVQVGIGGNVSEVISSFTGCTSNRLHYISFSQCELRGSLQFEIGQFQNLEQLVLSYNVISGPIPNSLGSLNSLLRLDLSFNQLNGVLPQALGQLHRLEYLDLSNNSISGPIPDSIGSLNSLVSLDISRNHLNGTLPQPICQLRGLHYLNLENNLIRGAIPDSMGSLSSLVTLILSENKFSGTLPASLGQLFQLLNLEVSFNSLEGLDMNLRGKDSQLGPFVTLEWNRSQLTRTHTN